MMKNLNVFMFLWISCALATPQHGISIFGNLKYASNYNNFEYVNPHAPKGGDFKEAALGTFDNLNPFIISGTSAHILLKCHATLLSQSLDEEGAMYAYVAEAIEILQDDKTNITRIVFYLNPKAYFSNGEPITADDVIFSLNILKTKGLPIYKSYYQDILKVEKESAHKVVFYVQSKTSKEIPLILGQLPILCEKFFKDYDFSKTLTVASPVSGPYCIESYEFGKKIVLKRVKNWWGESVASQKGLYNFDRYIVEFFRDTSAMFEAFKAGQVDVRKENNSQYWASSYNFEAVQKGLVIKDEYVSKLPYAARGFFFNLRRSIFKDWRVRKAINDLFNFEWANKSLFSSQYERNLSFFGKSELSQKGLPQGEELDILISLKNQIKPEILSKVFTVPVYDTLEKTRQNRENAYELLKQAGYELVEGKLIHKVTKKPLVIEYLICDKALEKAGLYFRNCLKPLGIELKVRLLDAASYEERVRKFDYDMITFIIHQTLIPGNEQFSYWGSKAADEEGSFNISGIRDKAVDQLIQKLIQATSYESLKQRARALDRVLLWHYIMVPQWQAPCVRYAYWNKFKKPEITPIYSVYPFYDSWWFDEDKLKNYSTIAPSSNHVEADSSPGFFKRIWIKILSWFGVSNS